MIKKPEEISEKIVKILFEISSEQRLNILLKLNEKSSKLTTLAKELEATTPEVKRNLDRLVKTKLIVKNSEGHFNLTSYGKTICAQMPSFVFITDNRKFFEDHNFEDLPTKFIQRLGGLENAQHVKGFVKVLEKWESIHSNADSYIYNILDEIPYLPEIIDTISSKLENKIKIQSIISEEAIIPQDRKEIFKEKEFQKFLKDETLTKTNDKTRFYRIINQ